ncbi:MAG: DUF429 domain-containing protein [Promethearchaeia archaeon]
MDKSKFYGIDGCSGGWLTIGTTDMQEWDIKIYSTIKEFWNDILEPEIVLIDIPIGLKDNGPAARECDKIARRILTGKRSSSIFPTPCRSALNASNYKEANKINREKTGKGLSKQTWYISNKIKEVDNFLRENQKLEEIIIESHPELCFTALNDYKPIEHYKKTEMGIKERLKVLEKYYKKVKNLITKRFRQIKEEGDLVTDDFLDSLILCISATLGQNNLRYIPEEYENDSKGLPMRMALPKKEIN